MNNLFMFGVVVFLAGTFLSFTLEGRTGYATAQLTASLSETATTMTVNSTTGFSTSDFVIIEKEDIGYTGTTATTFTGLTRGFHNTKASGHQSDTRVYSEGSGFIDKAIGFDVAEAFSDGGLLGVLKGTVKTVAQLPDFLRLLARIVIWDYSYLEDSAVYVKYFLLYPLSAGLVFGFFRLALGR